MNKKTTNRLVAIFNIIAIIALYIVTFSKNYLISSMVVDDNGGKCIYDSFIIDILLNNFQTILILMNCGIGITNIICAMQNKENKKICFWQLIFGSYYLYTGLSTILSFADIDENITDWISRIIFSIIPIILAIINLIKVKKNKPKVIQVISYVGVIILAMLHFIGIIGAYWNIIAAIMQLIYIHFQDKYIGENKSRKIINIILYNIVYAILSIGFFLIIIVSLITIKTNDEKRKSLLSELSNNISTINGATIKDIYIPVEKNYKFGFITENGKEKIPCEYDRVSSFNEIKINGNTYYVALAKNDNKFYIISKTNSNIEISGTLYKYLTNIENHLISQTINKYNKDTNYRLAYLESFELLFQVFTKGELTLTQQTIYKDEYGAGKEVELVEKNSKYIYRNKNYSMLIESINDEYDEKNDYNNNYNNYYDEEENTFYLSSYETKYKVTVTKSTGEIQSSTVYLPRSL